MSGQWPYVTAVALLSVLVPLVLASALVIWLNLRRR